jgi:hypothetical protein
MYGYQVYNHLGQVMSGTQSAIHYLGSIQVPASNTPGSQVVPGARYAIATPNQNDALAPRVDVDAATGLVSWPKSALRTDIEAIDNGSNPRAGMTITVLGTGRGSYGMDIRTEANTPILDTSAQAVALVASGVGAVGSVRADGTRRLDVNTNYATSDQLLVFVRSTGYVGISAMSTNYVQLMCCTSAPVDYKIFAVVDSFAGTAYRAGKYGILTFTLDGKVSFSGQEKYLTVYGSIQKTYPWLFELYPGDSNPYSGTYVPAPVTAPISEPYVCINALRGPTTSTLPPILGNSSYPAFTTAGCKVIGSQVTFKIDKVYTTWQGTMSLTLNFPELDQRFLICQ